MLGVVLLLSGCAAMDNADLSPERIAAIETNAALQPTCSDKSDCELKWARALDWVQKNSCWKLRSVSEMLISTEGPFDSTSPAFEITRFPHGDGSYEIRFRAGCGNIFGCAPSVKQLTASFNECVLYDSCESRRPICAL